MAHSTALSGRLAALKADLSPPAAAPPAGLSDPPPERVETLEGGDAAGPDLAPALDAQLRQVAGWVVAHPLAAMGLCVAVGILVGGFMKRGRAHD